MMLTIVTAEVCKYDAFLIIFLIRDAMNVSKRHRVYIHVYNEYLVDKAYI